MIFLPTFHHCGDLGIHDTRYKHWANFISLYTPMKVSRPNSLGVWPHGQFSPAPLKLLTMLKRSLQTATSAAWSSYRESLPSEFQVNQKSTSKNLKFLDGVSSSHFFRCLDSLGTGITGICDYVHRHTAFFMESNQGIGIIVWTFTSGFAPHPKASQENE